MASLQIDEVHICSAGMFEPGFLISSAECVKKIIKSMEANHNVSALLGNSELNQGVSYDILNMLVHPSYLKRRYRSHNYDVGVFMVSRLIIYNSAIELENWHK